MPAVPSGMLLFHRDFRGLTGGHLKVSHYVSHAADSTRYHPRVYLAPTSRRESNPFSTGPAPPLTEWRPDDASALFLAGLDWQAVPPRWDRPIVNLVQGVRHADRGDPRRDFLGRRAVRICVSDEVADAVRGTGLVEGPVFTIPNGVDVPTVVPTDGPRPVRLLVAGWKHRALTTDVAARLAAAGAAPDVIDRALPREAFLARLAAAEVVVLIPLEREGCFLPALEAFALGCVVVCPDSVGNRQFCRHRDTCLRPIHAPECIVAAALEALAMSESERARMVAAAADEARIRSLDRERRAFLDILDHLDDIW